MNYTVIAVSPVDNEPVSLNEAKDQLRLESSFTLDDAYIMSLISAARDRAERYCNRFFAAKQVRIIFNEPLPMAEIKLPFPNLQSIESIQYDQAGTIDPLTYYVDLDRQRITALSAWPIADNYRINATTGEPVEMSGVKQAILLMVTDMYELRTETAVGVSLASNPALQGLLYPYRENLGI